METFLQVTNLAKRYPIKGEKNKELSIFENVNFEIKKGEFVCIIGHSGCGKSTILNNLAGLDLPSDSSIAMEGNRFDKPSLERGVIFQNHSLLPWLTAFENVFMAIQCKHKNMIKQEVGIKTKYFLKLVGLEASMHKKPSELSGGMKQRVGIARAFAIEPKLLLMDEPFGALDALTRGNIQDQLLEICEKTRQTTFMITHDIDEAILLSDRILLMSNGPEARVAECVAIDIPKPRKRSEIVKHPSYYKIRNHLVDFLVNKSGAIRNQLQEGLISDANFPLQIDSTQL